MNAESLLRRYLEQRLELGDGELVLPSMTAAQALRALRALALTRAGAREPRALDTPPRDGEPDAGSDWRATLRAAGVAEEDRQPRRSEPPRELRSPRAAAAASDAASERARGASHGPDTSAESAPPAPIAPTGLVVGAADRELFAGPVGQAGSVDEIARMVSVCTRCDLYRTARNPVPGEGSPHAKLMCVGEAPGATEDETGRPFVGQAGQLLTKILGAINLSRDEVFIVNVLKHRPPGNRNPRPEEVEACRPYLVRQIELVQPRVIIAFGTFAAQSLLETKLAIGKLRGAIHRYHGTPVIVTYHPAALLRNPAWKRPTWDDVQLARRILDSADA